MGQYHLITNLDKKEYIFPHQLGDGLKLGEQGNSVGGSMSALCLLLAASNKGGARGGGDLNYDGPGAELIGSWAGDRIVIIGDYQEPGDLPLELGDELHGSSTLYEEVREGYTDLSKQLRPLLAEFSDVKFDERVSDSCRREPIAPHQEQVVSLRPDMVIQAGLPMSRYNRITRHLDRVLELVSKMPAVTGIEARDLLYRVQVELSGKSE